MRQSTPWSPIRHHRPTYMINVPPLRLGAWSLIRLSSISGMYTLPECRSKGCWKMRSSDMAAASPTCIMASRLTCLSHHMDVREPLKVGKGRIERESMSDKLSWDHEETWDMRTKYPDRLNTKRKTIKEGRWRIGGTMYIQRYEDPPTKPHPTGR